MKHPTIDHNFYQKLYLIVLICCGSRATTLDNEWVHNILYCEHHGAKTISYICNLVSQVPSWLLLPWCQGYCLGQVNLSLSITFKISRRSVRGLDMTPQYFKNDVNQNMSLGAPPWVSGCLGTDHPHHCIVPHTPKLHPQASQLGWGTADRARGRKTGGVIKHLGFLEISSETLPAILVAK